MTDPVEYVIAFSTIVVQGVFAWSLIRFRTSMGAWTEELRKERRAADAVTRSNQNVVTWLAHHTNSTAEPLPYHDDNEEHVA